MSHSLSPCTFISCGVSYDRCLLSCNIVRTYHTTVFAQAAAAAAAAEAEPVDPQTAALVEGAKAALGVLAFAALGVSSQGSHDFTEMLTILTLVSF